MLPQRSLVSSSTSKVGEGSLLVTTQGTVWKGTKIKVSPVHEGLDRESLHRPVTHGSLPLYYHTLIINYHSRVVHHGYLAAE